MTKASRHGDCHVHLPIGFERQPWDVGAHAASETCPKKYLVAAMWLSTNCVERG
jgi:hypothetical protein